MRPQTYAIRALVLGFLLSMLPAPVQANGVAITSPAQRRLRDLDVTQDGHIDRQDIAQLEALAARLRPGDRDMYYAGPRRWPLALDGDAPEVAIEAAWMAKQARLVVASRGPGLDLNSTIAGFWSHDFPGYQAGEMTPVAVCEAIQTMDLSTYKRAGLIPTAVFDLDETVWRGHAMEALLAALLGDDLPHQRRAMGGQLYARWRQQLRQPSSPRIAKEVFYGLAALLRDMAPTQVRAAATRAFGHGALDTPPWRSQMHHAHACGMRDIIARLQARGVRVYLISASLAPIVDAAAVELGVPAEDARGSLLATAFGRYTGEVAQNTYTIKAAVVRGWLAAPPILAFGDSPSSDFDMLKEALGVAFMVNPGAKMQQRDDQDAQGRFVGLSFTGTEVQAGHAREM